MKKLLLLVNLHAGKAEVGPCVGDMVDYYNKVGFTVTVYSTQYSGNITDIVRDCGAEYANIVVCGGDGSLNEAVNALMSLEGKKPRLGYVPCGSANDFAAGVGIPLEIGDAYRAAVDAPSFAVDVGRLNERYFSYVAAFGIFTTLPYETPQTIKNILGYQAYVLEGIKQLSSLRAWKMRVEYDENIVEDEFILGFVSNTNRVAGMKLMLPADFSDGVFEVALIKKPKMLTLLPSLITSLVDNKLDNDLILAFKSSSLRLSCEEAVQWTLDGENGGAHKKTEIKVLNRAIEINVPRE